MKIDKNGVVTLELRTRAKFDLRMDTLPPATITNVLVMTDEKGEINGWSIGVYNKIEGRDDKEAK